MHAPMAAFRRPASPARSWPSTVANVSPCRRSSAVSPTQRIGVIPAARTACIFRLMCSSLSPNSFLRSEWPRTTYRQPSSTSIAGEISPVNAPADSQWQFCAPSAIGLPDSSSPTTWSAVKGGHRTTSTPRGRRSPSSTPAVRPRAPASVPFIFQLATTSGVRITRP